MGIHPDRRTATGRARPARLSLGILSLVLAACATSLPPTAIPLTSTGAPGAPVPFHWLLAPDGALRLQGGTLHAIADEVRLLDDAGAAVTSAATTMIGSGTPGLCGEPQARGMVAAELRPPDVRKWPGQYRLEARVGGAWHPTQLTQAC